MTFRTIRNIGVQVSFFNLIGIRILKVVTYLIALYMYFTSNAFITIKNNISKYTKECNELNDHIEYLKSTYTLIKRVNYGQGSLSDTSVYNMKRKHWKNEVKNAYVHQCSGSVVKNASNQPFKYICKYFNIKSDEQTLENFEEVLNNFSAVEQGKHLLNKQKNEIVDSLKNSINPWVMYFHKERVEKELGFKEVDLSNLYFPVYTFQYVSAGGNSSTRFDIKFSTGQIENFVKYLSDLVKFRKSVQGQRSLMTSALREKIKQRDNYTCKICNLSTRQERNLLLEIDHIIPLSRGGVTSESNLQTLCWKCNRSKGSKIL